MKRHNTQNIPTSREIRKLANSPPTSNAGVGWNGRRVMPELYDMDDYETLQIVAEICAIQDLLDQPD